MGGERGATARMRLDGKICCACKSWLPKPHTLGEQYCARCKPPQNVVYASFERKQTWEVIFYHSTTQRKLRIVRFEDPEKLREMAQRGNALSNLEAKQALEHGIDLGKGGMFLKLTPEQYKKLAGK